MRVEVLRAPRVIRPQNCCGSASMKSAKYGIEGRLIIWFVLASLIVVLMLALSYLSALRLRESEVFWVEHGYQIIAELEASYVTLKDAESGQRTYLLTGNENFLNPLKTSADKFRAQLDRLKSLTADNPRQHARMEKLEKLGIERINILQTQVRLKQERGAEVASQDILKESGIRKMAEIYSLVDEISREEESLLTQRRAQADGRGITKAERRTGRSRRAPNCGNRGQQQGVGGLLLLGLARPARAASPRRQLRQSAAGACGRFSRQDRGKLPAAHRRGGQRHGTTD